MFIGHFALGFAAKRAAPHVPLAVLLAAAQFADVLWPVLVALGIEHVLIAPGITAFSPLQFVSYPFSHSLVALAMWGLALSLVYRRVAGDRPGSHVLSALVVSHWVLDFVTHRPDMPVVPFGPRVGLGLWNSVPGTLLVEFLLYAVGIWLYLRTTVAKDKAGRWAFWSLAGVLLVFYFGAIATVPPSVSAIWATGILGTVLILAWSVWVDRHRTVRPEM